MKQFDAVRKTIRKDCRSAMLLPVIVLVLYQIFNGILSVFISNRLGNLTDAIFATDRAQGLQELPILIVCISISIFVIPFVDLIGCILMLNYALRHDELVLCRFLDKTYESVRNIDKGEAQQRLEDDACAMRIDWVTVMEKGFYIPPVLFLALLFSLRLSVNYTFVVIFVSLAKIIVPMLVKKAEKKYDAETNDYKIRAKIIEGEWNERPYIARLFGLVEPLIKKYDQNFYDYYKNTFLKSLRCSTIADNCLTFLDTFCLLMILLIGALFVSTGEITAGAVASMAGYFTLYSSIMEHVALIIRRVPLIQNRIDRLTLLYSDPEELDGICVKKVDTIDAKSLSYSYDSLNPVFELNFTIRKGTKVAICGENGSGKSTLLSILCGLNKRYHGSVQLNGIELRECSVTSWREQFAFAQQNPYLFEGTVRENICIGNLNASKESVDAAIYQVGLESIADRNISMNQNDLSGGEKQKISIARALVKDTPYLILDEPTNHLDESLVQWLNHFIRQSTKTIIYITHDETLAELADQIIRL